MTSKSPKIRLAKFLAEAGVASRRKAEEIIKQGRVTIAGKVVKDVATTVSDTSSNIKVDNKSLNKEKKVYYLLNKPVGYVCSVRDPHNKQTVVSLVPKSPKVVPVGRLDKNSQGLLLLTNDGELAYELTHPKFEVKKVYQVTVNKELSKDIVNILVKQGVKLEEGLAKADKVKIVGPKELEIVIHQGWKRQIRRMLTKAGYSTVKLVRVAEGKLKLGNLEAGKYKILSKSDIK